MCKVKAKFEKPVTSQCGKFKADVPAAQRQRYTVPILVWRDGGIRYAECRLLIY